MKNWTDATTHLLMSLEGKHAYRPCAADSTIKKLSDAGLIEQAEGYDTWRLTEEGENTVKQVRNHFDTGELSELPIAFRRYYFRYERIDRLPANGLTRTALHDRSAEIRKKAAELLDINDRLSKKTCDALAHDEDMGIRYIAAKQADPHLFFEETDNTVVERLIRAHRADRVCMKHWLKSGNMAIRRLAALMANDDEIDAILDGLDSETAVGVICEKPEWATGERVKRLLARTEDRVWRGVLVGYMRDASDELIDRLCREGYAYRLAERLEEYRNLVRQTVKAGRLLSGDSEIRRKIWERAEREVG